MEVEVTFLAKAGETHCSIKLSGLPSCCEAHELRDYLEKTLPSLNEVCENVMKAHRRANTE